ncbi:glutaredoxin 3 [Ureibacillus xyleni]|uniref:Glutaredoxin 3 n=1 Tax=Ureibacillus xyleni TaxID=614648 RepID=A0A285SE75_9BACL|nr:glutaredoxin domain-containing protein [Ureibacillus xyleni]SOC05536.1 glutaredoxin 3 [Ureibacillus xyleni]
MMKLYTKTVCPKCLWIKSELLQAGISFETINIDHDEQAKEKIIEAGLLTVPVVEMDGLFLTDINEILAKIELNMK